MKGLKCLAGFLAGSLSLTLLGGCGVENSSILTETTVVMSESVDDVEQNSENEAVEAEALTANYDADDLDESWSEGKATIIKCNGTSSEISGDGIQAEGNILKITQAGTYVFSGNMSDGQIQADAGKDDVVHIVLAGLTASSGSSSVIYGIQSKKIVITLAKGQENILSDASSYVYENDSDAEPNACIFSKDDVTVNGEGSLTVYGNYEDGIHSQADLKIINGTLNINAQHHGLKGKDSVTIKDGDFTMDSSDDSIHSNGNVTINGGTYMIDSEGDGIHADQELVVNGGTIRINKSYEGLEGMTVDIRAGDIDITSTDDGINSAGGSDTAMGGQSGQNSFAAGEDCWIRISGGDIYVKASGDGIDSNGNLYMDGGMLVVEGPEDSANGALDYEGTAEITGGTFVGTGSSDMAMAFGDSSTQCSVNVVVDRMLPSGTTVTLADSSGEEILSVSPTKSFDCIQISSSLLVSGETYTVTYGNGDSKEIRLDGVSVWSGRSAAGGGSDGQSQRVQ